MCTYLIPFGSNRPLSSWVSFTTLQTQNGSMVKQISVIKFCNNKLMIKALNIESNVKLNTDRCARLSLVSRGTRRTLQQRRKCWSVISNASCRHIIKDIYYVLNSVVAYWFSFQTSVAQASTFTLQSLTNTNGQLINVRSHISVTTYPSIKNVRLLSISYFCYNEAARVTYRQSGWSHGSWISRCPWRALR